MAARPACSVVGRALRCKSAVGVQGLHLSAGRHLDALGRRRWVRPRRRREDPWGRAAGIGWLHRFAIIHGATASRSFMGRLDDVVVLASQSPGPSCRGCRQVRRAKPVMRCFPWVSSDVPCARRRGAPASGGPRCMRRRSPASVAQSRRWRGQNRGHTETTARAPLGRTNLRNLQWAGRVGSSRCVVAMMHG